MAISQMSEVIHHLRRALLLRDGAGLTDGQLLEDYISQRDEAALAALVQRHGPMVWGVCRRVLSNYHDAEDAFQATFLVLVRRAASIGSPELLANWLYGVAHQTAIKARATVAKRKARERQATEMPEPAVVEQDLWNDLQPLLDQELSRLPDISRVVIVLCDLEGKTRKEAARHLGLPEGTVGSRLARARVLLAKRLTERGATLTGGALAAVLAQNVVSAGVPASVASNTISAAGSFAAGHGAATGLVSGKVAALTEGVLKTMMMSKLKAVVALVLVLGFLGTGATVLTLRSATARDKPPIAKAPQSTARERMDSIEGIWEMVSAVYDGTPWPRLEKAVWTITKTHVEYNETTKDAYTINSKASPKQIDITQIRPGNEHGDGAKALGIYEVKGDTLKICIGHSNTRPRAFEGTAGRNLHTLKRVKAPEKHEPEKEGFTAWGKAVGGLQASLGFHPGQKRAYSHGETVKLVVRVRNVGKEEVKFQYLRQFFIEKPPTITDGKGKPVPQPRYEAGGQVHIPVEVNLAPGKEIELYELERELGPTSESGNNRFYTLYGTGKVSVQYERVLGNSSSGTITLDPTLSKLATGKLELEIKSDPPPATWGKEVVGLQAGLAYRPGERRAYYYGEMVTLVVWVRNVGKEEAKFQYLYPVIEHQPIVTDGDGKPVPQPNDKSLGQRLPLEVNLAPGKAIVLHELKRQIRPASESGNKKDSTLYGTGKISVQYERALGDPSQGLPGWKLDPVLSRLATGKLEVEIKSDPPPDATEKKAPDAPVPAAKEAAWQAEFRKAYGLKDGEYVKRVPPPFIPERKDFVLPRFPGADDKSVNGLLTYGVLFVDEDGKTLSYRAMVSTDATDFEEPPIAVRKKRMSLRSVIAYSTGRMTPEVVFDARVYVVTP
jgi:RNA polymerase sigma factor (sigma-70 family)